MVAPRQKPTKTLDFRMMSFNMRGLTKVEKRIKVQHLLKTLAHPIDFLCGQEHKIRKAHIGWLESIWPVASFIVAPAIDSVNAKRNNKVPAGCGGIFLAIGPKIKDFVTTNGITPSTRVFWAHVDHPALGNIGILSLYAPNARKDHTKLWHELADVLDSGRNWIVVGDFNMVDKIGDRKGGSNRIVKGGEKSSWNRLCRKLCLVDSYIYKPGHLKYSWDSKKRGRHDPAVQALQNIGERVLKRLDRIHFCDFARASKFTICSSIMPGYCLSDHAPVLATIRTTSQHSRPSLYRINARHLQDELLLSKLKELWTT